MDTPQFEVHTTPVISVSPVDLSSPGRDSKLQVRVSAPVTGHDLPIIVFSHGFGSSMDAYAPLVNFWAARGFAVIQPTFLDSTTLGSNPYASHDEAVKNYLDDPRKVSMWRYRVEDVKRILDQLGLIENTVSGLKGRLDRSRIAAVGHSFGAQTTAMLLGARVIGSDGKLGEDFYDARIKVGVLLCVGGRGGEALTPFANENFPHLNQTYADMATKTFVVAGDNDDSPLTTLGPAWFTEAYTLSPGAEALLTLFGGKHMFGGISGNLVTETTDESPERVAAVQRLTWAYLQSVFFANSNAWSITVAALSEDLHAPGRVDCK